MKISILDCTLRDGGYINNWAFKNEQTSNILASLDSAKVDIVECGYLNDKEEHSVDSTLFSDTQAIDQHLKALSGDAAYVVMINYGDYDITNLPEKYQTQLDGIRLAFHKKNLMEVVDAAKLITEKGYKLFFQPMLTDLYDEDELDTLLQICNDINPYAAYIVDSFGSMQKDQLLKLLQKYSDQLNKEIVIGFHAHNNLQLAFANSIAFIEAREKRSMIVDSSIYGMGRGAGNLNTELIANYLNEKGAAYKITPLLEVIDTHLDAIYRDTYWGYSAAYYLSATMKIHPNYARYLINKKSLTVASIEKILGMIDADKINSFDTEYIERLFESYNANLLRTDITTTIELEKDEILIVASGSSVQGHTREIQSYIKKANPAIIAVNHIDEFIHSDYLFFSNEKRYTEFFSHLKPEMNVLVTSNITADTKTAKCIDFDTLYSYKNISSSNVAILLLNLLALNGIKKVSIAGLDGFNLNNVNNYSYSESGRILDKKYLIKENEMIQNALDVLQKELDINFITPSIFTKD